MIRHSIATRLQSLGPRIAFLAVLCLMTAGCHSSKPVMEGTVTLDGIPIEKGTIRLIPFDGNGQTAGCGIVDGKYRMQAAPGRMQVRINANRKDGTMLDPLNPGSGARVDRYREYIPDRYNENSELEFTVQAGRNMADFMLEGELSAGPDGQAQ